MTMRYTRQNWKNHNWIKSTHGSMWLTIPRSQATLGEHRARQHRKRPDKIQIESKHFRAASSRRPTHVQSAVYKRPSSLRLRLDHRCYGAICHFGRQRPKCCELEIGGRPGDHPPDICTRASERIGEWSPQTKILQKRLGDAIEKISFDRGYYSEYNDRGLKKMLSNPCLPKHGTNEYAEQMENASVEFVRRGNAIRKSNRRLTCCYRATG